MPVPITKARSGSTSEAAPGHPKAGAGTTRGQRPPPVQLPHERYADAPKTPGPKTPADEALDFFESTERGDARIQVYELRLEPDGGPNREAAYTRLPPAYKPYILRVTIDAGSPASRNGVFKTNFPLDGGKFSRDHFVERKLPTDFSKPIKIDLPISHAGAFVYWLEYDGSQGRIKAREGYFNIDPILTTYRRTPVIDHKTLAVQAQTGFVEPRESVNIPLDGIAMLTVVSKWMGPLPEWEQHFAEARTRGYNMLHYTPLQQRGESKSPYSIADQMAFDSGLFEDNYDGSKEEGTQRVKDILKLAKKQYGLMSLTDVVLNHTANNRFSPYNCPHLTPALELDNAIIDFSTDLASRGLPTLITSQKDIDTLIDALKEHIAKLNLWQYYVLNGQSEKEAVADAIAASKITPWTGPDIVGKSVAEIADIVRGEGNLEHVGEFAERFMITVNPSVAAGIVKTAFVDLGDATPAAYGEAWGRVVDVLNVDRYKEWEEDTKVAIENIINRVKWTRLDENGPKVGEINKTMPLVDTYFTRIPKNSRTAKHDPRALAVANNGWIWAADPLANFALRPSKAYLRREVIVWGDCVKLRYGDGPSDNPWLWKHMTEYVQSLAVLFDGFRIDNCHSTPLHVGVALLDAARAVNPDLYVCAELFTGSEEMDVHFVSRLGINSLIREAMNGWDPKDFARLLHRYGLGKPIGSMDESCLTSHEDLPPPTGKGATRPAAVTPIRGSAPHALMYDLTHDNESPLHKRSAEDALSTGALVTFGLSATGSNKGFDDLYPKLLDLVGDNRKYETSDGGKVDRGIAKVKKVLNQLHTEMVLAGFKEGHVHQEGDYIAIHRVHPATQKGYFLIAHTAFGSTKGSKARGDVNPISLKSTKARFILGASIDIPSYELEASKTTISGLPSTLKELAEVPPKVTDDGCELIVPEEFPPGSILLYETQLVGVDPNLESACAEGADEAFAELDLVDLNVVLHRCSGEERDATNGEIGTYNIGGLGDLVYCGLEGWMHPLRHVMNHNDLGHPLCENLRQGDWALGYVQSRLEKQTPTFPRLAKPAAWFKSRFDLIRAQVPGFLRPKYFAIVIFSAYKVARRIAIEQCSEFVVSGHDFTQNLALCQIQMHGLVQSASIDPGKVVPSLAAGLPHFAGGWARTWGRDVFISLRGLFLATGNYAAARAHILAFCATLKHGLIPNLLDALRTPRYNSRDSPWWMVQNIQDYCNMAPEGLALLEAPVKRRFPQDDTFVPWDDPRAYAYSSSVAEIIQEILQRHAKGISFREHNAGPNLDMQMSDEGFNIEVKVDWETGFTLGGNWKNCGTWMDKMGESQKAGTKGTPGTPRDGAPVEITGLLFSTLRWLDGLGSKFPFKGVQATIDGQEKLVTYREWATLIQNAFERYYYVPLNPVEDPDYVVDPRIINQRGIYKDVYGSGAGREWSDYQLRCNFPIAMVVAPELFNPEHALGALKIADKRLRGPLGMKTLDEGDSQYRGYYDNSNDSDDASIAKGLNYHQGPEWGWPLGYFLRAYLKFDQIAGAGKNDQAEMDAPTAAEDQTPSTPELRRTYLSLLSHNAIVELVLSLNADVTSSLFPSDLAGEVRRMQSSSATDDVDGEGSPDPQPAPPPRAPSVPPAGGPRTRAGAARAYAAALASKDTPSTRPSPAPGGVSFPQTPEPQQPQQSPPPFAPISQPYPSLIVHLPGGSPPIPSPTTPTNHASTAANPLPGIGPVRNTPAKKTRTGVIGGYNPITSIGPSSEGLPSYEEMIVLALMEGQDDEGVAPKDVFAWMSARWPLNANFRPSASQALQKAYKRGRLEKVGTKYKLNPNWHGGATTNRTTRRPQSMAEVPGNYAWAPPPVPPVVSVPPDPRTRHSITPNPSTEPPASQQTQTEFDAQAQVASLLKALQEAGPGPSNPNPNSSGPEQNQPPNVEEGVHTHLPHMSIPGAADGARPIQSSPETAVIVPTTGSPSALGPSQSPVQISQLPASMPPLPAPVQPGLPTPPIQAIMSPVQSQNGILPLQNPTSPPIQNGVSSQPTTNTSLSQPQPSQPPQPQVLHQPHVPPQNSAIPQPPHPMPPGVPMTYPSFHTTPSALQASLVTLASQLANMSKTNQGA
ncbi:4-alpha-glucanotransferase [Rhizoctonia solani AG-1 IB]|uniref:Glycogen debranching enzyme n=1 Tax=Thanatephorus cucumeris (strain AG1-IB / isolate 7/3/14) TaxID=1108050 RepID=M5BPU2_THACB|nr:4-alpha-glucanotransferase [Rhizoctonia solani AG-1 IB]